MDILYLLIPISLIIVAIAVWVFMWAIRSGQYEDLEGPAYRILMDDDDPPPVPHEPESKPEGKPD
jgi:cbb3-type cytochrome oxidase maturation protein